MTSLSVSPVIHSHHSKLDEAYELTDDFHSQYQDQDIWVPKFFQYDGASIPPPAYQIIGTPFNPRLMEAAVVHDWLYYTQQFPRATADEIFYELLIKAGVPKLKAILMRESVQGFGAWYWDNDEEDDAYLTELKQKIINDDRDPAKYHFPVLLPS